MGSTLEYNDKSDEELMALIARRDYNAVATLVSRHQRGLLNLFYRYTNDRLLAEDLTQEVFLRVYKSAPLYEARSLFKVWLYRIAKNVCLNELKALRILEKLPEQKTETESPQEEMIRAEREIRVRQAIEMLPERQRLALILRRFQGLSQEETAEVMETTSEAIEGLLARAKAKLRSALADLQQ
ncbi:MAG: sigma-70 family RNA polymerase sigma factor [Thermodesulfobacteriota bacterium]